MLASPLPVFCSFLWLHLRMFQTTFYYPTLLLHLLQLQLQLLAAIIFLDCTVSNFVSYFRISMLAQPLPVFCSFLWLHLRMFRTTFYYPTLYSSICYNYSFSSCDNFLVCTVSNFVSYFRISMLAQPLPVFCSFLWLHLRILRTTFYYRTLQLHLLQLQLQLWRYIIILGQTVGRLHGNIFSF